MRPTSTSLLPTYLRGAVIARVARGSAMPAALDPVEHSEPVAPVIAVSARDVRERRHDGAVLIAPDAEAALFASREPLSSPFLRMTAVREYSAQTRTKDVLGRVVDVVVS